VDGSSQAAQRPPCSVGLIRLSLPRGNLHAKIGRDPCLWEQSPNVQGFVLVPLNPRIKVERPSEVGRGGNIYTLAKDLYPNSLLVLVSNMGVPLTRGVHGARGGGWAVTAGN